ncbi:MAG: radical SAM protein [Chloroflexi bacterium]|nr:radical SAM protein [Chloroflexota bacterium]
MSLNVAAWQERSVAAGPGVRFVVWLQGCPLRCQGCINPDFLPIEPRNVLPVSQLAHRIAVTSGIEGVTYTGGEPMVQARGLALLSEALASTGLSILCYSGYTLEQLQACSDPWIDRLLRCTDILIDGPYVRERAAILRWRGSNNQRIHFLTPKYRGLAGSLRADQAEIEFSVGVDALTVTGTWPKSLLERLAPRLRG